MFSTCALPLYNYNILQVTSVTTQITSQTHSSSLQFVFGLHLERSLMYVTNIYSHLSRNHLWPHRWKVPSNFIIKMTLLSLSFCEDRSVDNYKAKNSLQKTWLLVCHLWGWREDKLGCPNEVMDLLWQRLTKVLFNPCLCKARCLGGFIPLDSNI